ncbi:MAG: AAA family ATPase [Chloroflexi bacterium]|nr:AAA family ATPase [Chloroflexota bacterium]
MLQRLILENFKPFGRRQVIRFAPLTLIYGPNSAGKSSILQSLLLLKQTLQETGDREAPLVPRGNLIDLGNFRSIVFGHDVSRKIEITPFMRVGYLDPPGELHVYPIHGLDVGGAGFEFRLDQDTKAVELASVPFYAGRFDIPLFRLLPVPKESRRSLTWDERQRIWTGRTLRRITSDALILGELCLENLYWEEWYRFYRENVHERYLAALGDVRSSLSGLMPTTVGFSESVVDELVASVQTHSSAASEYSGRPAAARRAIIGWIDDELVRRAAYRFDDFIADIRRWQPFRFSLRAFLPICSHCQRPGRWVVAALDQF